MEKKKPFYDSLQDIVNSLEAQWLGLCTSTAEGMVSCPNDLRALRHGQKKRHCPIKHMAEGKTGGKKKEGSLLNKLSSQQRKQAMSVLDH